MTRSRYALLSSIVAVALIAGSLRYHFSSTVVEPAPANAAQGGGKGASAAAQSTSVSASSAVPIRLPRAAQPNRPQPIGTLLRASWGSGAGQLGRSRPEEANPEAAPAFARDAAGNMVVLDSVNGRIARFSSDGKPLDSIPSPVTSPQELLTSADGSILVMDRLVDKNVTLLDKDGRVAAKVPLEGAGLEKSGSATGLFRDKDGIYVENEHSQLVRIADGRGKPDPERPLLDGRPTRDGRSLVSAHLIDRLSGRFFIRAMDRASGALRYQQQLTLPTPLLAIVFLDSDPAGRIYAGVHVGSEVRPGEMVDEAIQVVCLSPDAEVLGVVSMAANTMPEETFRDLTVLDDGTILYMQRSESGVAITSHRCG